MNNIGIITAMSSEYNSVLKSLKKNHSISLNKKSGKNQYKLVTGKFKENRIFLIQTGVGYDNATRGIAYLLQNRDIHFILNIGIAGAINPGLSIGDPIICTSFINEINPENVINTNTVDYNMKNYGLIGGRIITVTKPLGDNDKRDSFHKTYYADVVDMESFAMAETCSHRNIPFASIKTISDMAGGDIGIFTIIFDSDGKFRISQLLKKVIKNPVKIWKLTGKMYNDYTKALRAIEIFINRFIEVL